jgi:hypothetical protein
MISSTTRRLVDEAPILREPEMAGMERIAGGRFKQPQDTAVGCRAFAAANLASAAALTGAYPRARMEHSAATWTARADLLHRLETGIAATRLRAATPIEIAEAE